MENQQSFTPKYSKYTREELQKKEDFWESFIDGIAMTALIAIPVVTTLYYAFSKPDNNSTTSRNMDNKGNTIENRINLVGSYKSK